MSNYSISHQQVETLLGWIKSGEIAIPEIQRPFVWKSSEVRDLLDSLYKGYPIGYIITWRNPNIKTKDGKLSEGRKILIDGQQRITALATSIHGISVLNEYYEKERITIAFHPIEKKFEVLNNIIKRDNSWIHDVGPIVTGSIRVTQLIRDYIKNNPNVNETELEDAVEELRSIHNKAIGIIELNSTLDIETVTTIFIRINSKGKSLSQGDFVMSKIAADEKYEGNLIRKTIDYFCHIYNKPEYLDYIESNDTDFIKTDYYEQIKWIGHSEDDLYYPDYEDILRVSLAFKFKRGKFSELANLLSGRNFEKKTFEEEIAEKSYSLLKESVLGFVNKTNFERFAMIIQSIGFIDYTFITSKFALNFCYALYLNLKEQGVNHSLIEKYIKKWFVLSMIKARYSGSAESTFDYDVKQIQEKGFETYLKLVEESELGTSFWDAGIFQELDSSNVNNPVFNVFLAFQINQNHRGFLSKDITIRDMMQHRGDLHHIYPKEYLKSGNLNKSKYNQVANLVYAQQEINIKLGKKSPKEYFDIVKEQCETGKLRIGNIIDWNQVKENLKQNAIPISIADGILNDYDTFLLERRKLIAKSVKQFYFDL